MIKEKKNKGQVSLEIVILIGILITVAIVLAAVFLDFSGKSIDSTKDTVSGTDDTVDDFLNDVNGNLSAYNTTVYIKGNTNLIF